MRGIPGSGKTTETNKIVKISLEQGLTCEVCSADEFFMKDDGKGGREYQFDGNQIANAHIDCQQRSMDAMNRKIDIVVIDNTCLAAYEAGPYVYYADMYGYIVEFVEPSSPQWKLFTEYRSRVNGNIKPDDPIVDKFLAFNVHNVPRQSLAKMMRKWQPVINIDAVLREYLQ